MAIFNISLRPFLSLHPLLLFFFFESVTQHRNRKFHHIQCNSPNSLLILGLFKMNYESISIFLNFPALIKTELFLWKPSRLFFVLPTPISDYHADDNFCAQYKHTTPSSLVKLQNYKYVALSQLFSFHQVRSISRKGYPVGR